jgi:uncharacterized alkaline shock family protein YloU
MVRHENENGSVNVSTSVYTDIVGEAVTSCFGVKAMAYRSMADGLVHMLRREAMGKGVKVFFHEDKTISIELHIVVENGMNIPAVCEAIINQVRYLVSSYTGVQVANVEVFVDSMTF